MILEVDDIEDDCEDSFDSVTFEMPKNEITKPKKKKTTTSNAKAAKGKSPANRSNTSKLREKTKHEQSSLIGSNLSNKMKVVKHEGSNEGGQSEFEIMVEKELS